MGPLEMVGKIWI